MSTPKIKKQTKFTTRYTNRFSAGFTAGFTLVEMLVATALFSIVIVIAMGSIITTIDINRKSQTLTLVMNNLNFALESMTRTIKTATFVEVDGATGLVKFKDQQGLYITYRLNEDEDGSAGTIEKCIKPTRDEGCSAIDFIPIIASQVKISRFDLIDINLEQNRQPRFLMVVKGYAELTPRTRSDFSIQTSISPRTVNYGEAITVDRTGPLE